jgi:hypothetical protein
MELVFWRIKRGWAASLEFTAISCVAGSALTLGLPIAWVPWTVAAVLVLKITAAIGVLYLARRYSSLQV